MPSIETSSLADPGVSVVVPVLNGARWLDDVLRSIQSGLAGRSYEILVVDDGSDDQSVAICQALADGRLAVIDGPRRGAAAAVNTGLRQARFAAVAQIDQDVIVCPGWFEVLSEALRDPRVAAAQGWYVTDPDAPVLARVMSLDLEQRYSRIADGETDHVCTGNVMWRRDAIRSIGLLDESLGYGYDNDLSYRLVSAGHRLVICRQARSFHRWRDGWAGYLGQQYGFGYGRLDLVARYRTRARGDAVSPAMMMAHPVLLLAVACMLLLALTAHLAGASPRPWLIAGVFVLGTLLAERAIAGIAATWRSRDLAGLLFPVVHLARDAAWAIAIVCWLARRLRRTPLAPAHSMRPRASEPVVVPAPTTEEL